MELPQLTELHPPDLQVPQLCLIPPSPYPVVPAPALVDDWVACGSCSKMETREATFFRRVGEICLLGLGTIGFPHIVQ